MTGEECIFTVEDKRANAPFDDVGVELDAPVVEETGEPIPMVQGVADGVGDRRLGRDPRELVLEPRSERDEKWFGSFLTHRAARLGTVAADRLLDRVERRDAGKRFARDWCVAFLGDIEELAPQMGPAEGEHDCLAGCSLGDRLVGRIAIALDDTAVAIEQLECMDCAATRSVAEGDRRRISPAPRPIISGNSPEESLFDASAAGIKHWRYGLVDRDCA